MTDTQTKKEIVRLKKYRTKVSKMIAVAESFHKKFSKVLTEGNQLYEDGILIIDGDLVREDDQVSYESETLYNILSEVNESIQNLEE